MLISIKQLHEFLGKNYSYNDYRKIFHKVNKDYYCLYGFKIRGYWEEDPNIFIELEKNIDKDVLRNFYKPSSEWIYAYEVESKNPPNYNFTIHYFEAKSLQDIKNTIKIYEKLIAFL